MCWRFGEILLRVLLSESVCRCPVSCIHLLRVRESLGKKCFAERLIEVCCLKDWMTHWVEWNILLGVKTWTVHELLETLCLKSDFINNIAFLYIINIGSFIITDVCFYYFFKLSSTNKSLCFSHFVGEIKNLHFLLTILFCWRNPVVLTTFRSQLKSEVTLSTDVQAVGERKYFSNNVAN